MALLLAAVPVSMAAQTAPGGEGRAAANRAVARSIASLMEARYVLPEVGRGAADTLRAVAARGAYDRLPDAGELAGALATDLRRTAPDGHLTVFVDPAIAAGLRRPPADATAAPDSTDDGGRAALRRGNYGVRRVEVMTGNVGYLELREFAPESPELAAAYGAALTVLAGTDAIVIDLRQNGGGHGSAAALLAGHFFRESVHLLDTYDRPTDRRTAWRTPADIPGPRRPDVPLYVLTSRATYSAAEAFAYGLQSAGRAVVVGDTTGGGAHPTEYHAVTDSIILALPESRSEHPVTRRNWQDVGVWPDVAAPADAALGRAHLAALERLRAEPANSASRAALEWDLEFVRAHASPVAVPAAVLRAMAGTYGPRTLTWEPDPAGGAGSLYYQLAGRPRFRLHAVRADAAVTRFVLTEDDRVEVTRAADGTLRLHKFDRAGQGVTAARAPSP